MNFDLLFALIFYILLYVYFKKNRSKFQIQAKFIALYKTKIGLKAMDSIAKKDSHKKIIVLGIVLTFAGIISLIQGLTTAIMITQGIGYSLIIIGLLLAIPLKFWAGLSVITGFAGMAIIFWFLLKGTFDMLFIKGALPAVAPILPGIKVIPGLPVMSFWHWILAILVVATVHEFTHGIFGRLYNTKIKSSGFVIFGPILGAFVEPDEKQLAKKSKAKQVAIFSGGPFANIITTIIFGVLLLFVFNPISTDIQMQDGIVVHSFMEGYPAEKLGIEMPFRIISVNGQQTTELQQFLEVMQEVQPGEDIDIGTDKGEFVMPTVENPNNASLPFLGISGLEIQQKIRLEVEEKYGSSLVKTYMWFHLFVFWLVIVSLGVGLFNLLPLGPLDGGRMFLTAATIFWNEKKARKIWGIVSYFCLLLIFINLAPFLWKLLVFIAKPLLLIIGI